MRMILKKGFTALMSALLLAFVNTSCTQEDTAVNDQMLEETSFAENVFAQLSADVDDAMPIEGVSSGRFGFRGFGFGFGQCMTRTVETPEDADYPKTITIAYDSTCTSGMNDVVKSGKIIITLTGHPGKEGTQRIVTFENFTVNGNSIEGTKTFTYKGQGQFDCTLTDGKIITHDGNVIIRTSTRTRTLIEGGDTEDRSDDVYEITGTATGETSDGLAYTKEIIEPLIVSKSCFWITKGIVETTIGDVTTTVDFGDGTCDDIATRTDADGNSEEFTMQMRIKKMWRHKMMHHNGK